jgi:hypothetical protein
MDWEVVWTDAAVADLEQIVRTSAGHSPTAIDNGGFNGMLPGRVLELAVK